MFYQSFLLVFAISFLLVNPVHSLPSLSRYLNITQAQRDLKIPLYFSSIYCGLSQTLADLAPVSSTPCGLRFRLLAVTSEPTTWYPVIETLPSFGKLWLLKTPLRQFDTPIDRVPWPLIDFTDRNSVIAPEDLDSRSSLYWEPDRNTPNQWMQTKNPDPALRDVTRGVFRWYAEEAVSKNRSTSQTVSLSGIPEREPPVPGGIGAMGVFNGINNFLILQPIPVGIQELDISMWIKCGAYSNKQIIMFAEAQIPTQFPSDNFVRQSCETQVLFSIFETSNLQMSILGGTPVMTGLSVCNPNTLNSWHFLRITFKQLQSSSRNSEVNGLTVSVNVDMGATFEFNTTAIPLVMSKVSVGADTRCDSLPQGACMDSARRMVTCFQPFSGLLDEIRFFDKIRPIHYVLWDWKRGWSKYEKDFYSSYAGINTLFSVTFEEVESFGQSQVWGNGISDYSPTILPSTSPVFSFNQSFHSIEINAAHIPTSKGCGVDALSSVVQFVPRVFDIQSIPIQSIVVQQQPNRGCALTLKSVASGFTEGNLIIAESLDPLYSYYGIYGSSAHRLMSLGSFYDTFVFSATADFNSDKLTSFGLVTLVASPGVSWDNSYTYSMTQGTTMIFSPRIYNVDFESVRVQIWTDPLPDCLYQVLSFDFNGNYVLGSVLRAGDFISHPKLLLAFRPPKYRSYPKQRLTFSALKYEFKVTYLMNPQKPIYVCKVDASTSCNTGSFFINVEPVKISPSWVSDSLISTTSLFDVDAESQPVISLLFNDPDSSDFLVSVHQYPAKGKLYEYSSSGGLGIPIPIADDKRIESWITSVLDSSDYSMIKDDKNLIGKFKLDDSLVSLKRNVVLPRGQLSVFTAQFGDTPLYAGSFNIYGAFSDKVYLYIDGSNFGDAMSRSDQDWFILYSGFLQLSNTSIKNAIQFYCQVPLIKQKFSLQFCPQRSKASAIFRFRFSVPTDSQVSYFSSISVSGTPSPMKYSLQNFDVIDASTYRTRFIYAAPLLFYGIDYMILSVTDCTSIPVLRNITFNIKPKFFPAVPVLYTQNLTAIGGASVVGSFAGSSLQNTEFDVIYLGSDAPISIMYRNSTLLKEGSILLDHLRYGTDVLIIPPSYSGGFPYAIIRYGFIDNGVQSPWVGEISVYIKCGVSYYHSKRICVVCPVGHFCNETGLLEPTKCPIGSFSQSTAQTTCKQCPPGYYAPRQGLVNCIPCESGTFSPFLGSKSCFPCNLGYFAKEVGSAKCNLCRKGTFSDTLGSSECKFCPAFSDTDLAYISDSKSKCKCQDGAFFNGVECVNCCYGATCQGNSFQPAARVGFWTNSTIWPSKSCYFIQCENFDDCKSESAVTSAISYVSESNVSSLFSNLSQGVSSNSTFSPPFLSSVNSNCAELRTSKLCFSCNYGYFKDSFGICHRCDDSSVLVSFAWRVVVIVAVSSLFLYSCLSKVRCLYILYSLLQSICFISRLPLNWSSGARLPFSIAWVAFLKLDFLPLSCWSIFTPNTESGSIKEAQAFTYILAVPSLLVSLSAMWFLVKLKNSTAPIFRLTIQNLDLVNPNITLQEWPTFYRLLADEISPKRTEFFKRSVFHAVTMAFSNMLLISSISALDLLSCRDLMHDGSSGYLLLDPEVDCKTNSKQSLRPLLVLFIFLSTTIYPICCCVKIQLLHSANLYQDEATVHMYGHLFMRYKRDVYWWEMAVMLRKSLLILVMGAFYDSTILLVALVLMIFSASMLGTVYFQPYRSSVENSAELYSMFTQIVIVFAGLYYYSVISFDPTKADPVFFGYVSQADICVWIIVSLCISLMFGVIFIDSRQLFEETGIKSVFLRLAVFTPKSQLAAQGNLLSTTFIECNSDLMWRYGSSSNRKIVMAVEANSENDGVTQEHSEFQNTSGAVALVQRQVLTVSSENKVLISKISKLEMHLKALKDDEENRKRAAEDLEKVTLEAKRAIGFLETLKRDCDERVEKAQYWSEMLQSTRMQRQSLEKELLAMKKAERNQASLIRTANSQFSKNVPPKNTND